MPHKTLLAVIPFCAAILAAQQTADIRIDNDLVTVSCSVDTRTGAPAENLKATDFKLLDDGQAREISNFWRESDLPVIVALVADVSGNQAESFKSHRDAITDFLNQIIGPRDRAMVVSVAQKTWLLSGLTGSAEALRAAIEKIGETGGKRASQLGPACRNATLPHTCGGTELWHALYYTAKELKPVSGRKAIVVLSDGLDTGSDVKLTDLVQMAQSAGTVVYSIKYARPMHLLSIGGTIAQTFSRGLERLSRETGGLQFPDPGKKTSEVFSKIESDLHNSYVLGFHAPADARDNKFHTLTVSTSRADLSVRSRAGYWAQ